MKRITFFIQNFSRPAGSERVTSLIAGMLCNKGYEVSVVSVCGNNKCFYPIDERIKLFTLIDSESVDNKRSFFKVYRALKRHYALNKPDVVIDIFASLSIYTLLLKRKFGYKTITWEHFNCKVDVGLNKFGRKYASRKADAIVTLTKADKEFYGQKFPKMRAKIVNIYNPSPYPATECDFGARGNVVLSVGRLTYQKGFDVLLNLWSCIEPQAEDWRLVIVGSGEEKDSLQKIIDEKKLVRAELAPATPQIEDYYKTAKLYVSTARYEGLPMTMIEAQSFGLPIISYDYAAGPSDIITQGYDGILVENENGDEFCREILKLMSDGEKIQKFSANALKSSFRFKDCAIENAWIELIDGLI